MAESAQPLHQLLELGAKHTRMLAFIVAASIFPPVYLPASTRSTMPPWCPCVWSSLLSRPGSTAAC